MNRPDEKDFKSYSLRNLSVWISDVLDSDATPEEIHTTIVTAIKERNQYHRACLNAGEALLRKFHVAIPPHRSDSNVNNPEFQKFWEDKDITGSDNY